MSDRLKRILIIVGFIFLVIIIGYAIYYFFFKPPITPQVPYYPPAGPTVPGQLPAVTNANVNRIIEEEYMGLPSIARVPPGAIISDKARGGYTKVSKKLDSAQSPVVAKDGSLIFYDATQGRFYKRNADGTITLLSSQRFFEVDKITWSKDTSKAILEYPDGSNIVYDFNQDKQYTLPKEMQDFDFADNSQLLAAEVIGERQEYNWLVTSNPDGSNIQFIERIGDQSANVEVDISPNNQVVATFRENSSANSQQVLFIGREGENFKSLNVTGRGFEGQWTANGQKLLYSTYQVENGFRPTLSFVDASGNNIGLNNVNSGLETWANKCTINTNSSAAFCAVPESLPEGSGWYPQLAQNTPDRFYKIDLNSGQVSLIAEPVGDEYFYSASSVFLSPDEQTLYFQDYSGGVFSISLP